MPPPGHNQVGGEPGQNQNSLERLYTSSGLGMPGDPPGGSERESLKHLLHLTSFMYFQETAAGLQIKTCFLSCAH